jgi:hypothetical protein
MGINRFIGNFNTQRALFSTVFTLLPISLSVGVLWNHLDSLSIFTGFYLVLTKVGLLLVEITAVFFLIWELTVEDKILSNYCFIGNIIIVLMVLLHVGAIFQYDSALAKIKADKKNTLDVSAQVLKLNNQLMIEQGQAIVGNVGDNARTKRETLKTLIETSAQSNRELSDKLLSSSDTKKEEDNIKTILPLGYITSGAMFIVPILVAFGLGMIALFLSKSSPQLEETIPEIKEVVEEPKNSDKPDTQEVQLPNVSDVIDEEETNEELISEESVEIKTEESEVQILTKDEILRELNK